MFQFGYLLTDRLIRPQIIVRSEEYRKGSKQDGAGCPSLGPDCSSQIVELEPTQKPNRGIPGIESPADQSREALRVTVAFAVVEQAFEEF